MKNDFNGQFCWFESSSAYPRLLTLTVSRLPLEEPYRRERQRGTLRPIRVLKKKYASTMDIGRANGVSAGTIGIQDGQLAADIARQLACGDARADLVRDIALAIRSARVLIIIPKSYDKNTEALLIETVELPPEKHYKALVAHPSLRRDRASFVEIAANCSYCQLSSDTIRVLFPGAHASKVRDDLRKEVEFSVTNGASFGCMWAERGWLPPFRFPSARVADDVDLGDSFFCVAYALARGVFEADAKKACRYALEVTTAVIEGVPIPPYQR